MIGSLPIQSCLGSSLARTAPTCGSQQDFPGLPVNQTQSFCLELCMSMLLHLLASTPGTLSLRHSAEGSGATSTSAEVGVRRLAGQNPPRAGGTSHGKLLNTMLGFSLGSLEEAYSTGIKRISQAPPAIVLSQPLYNMGHCQAPCIGKSTGTAKHRSCSRPWNL